MNLQEVLNRRSKCLVHEEPLRPCIFPPSYRNDQIRLDESGLHLYSHSQWDTWARPSLTGLGFRYDGTYYRNSVCPSWIQDGALFVYMMCKTCAQIPTREKETLGYISLMEVRTVQYYYSFSLLPTIDDRYDILLDREKIKYVRDDKFYHIDIDLTTRRAFCGIGSCAGNIIISDMISKMTNIKLPEMDLENVRDIDQLVEKLRIYNLFS
jgi:hypothetical protein